MGGEQSEPHLHARTMNRDPVEPVPFGPYLGGHDFTTNSKVAAAPYSLFSPCCHTTECFPSITSSVISTPRCAGRQCITIESFAATFRRSEFIWKPLNACILRFLSFSSPMLTHTSV